MAPTTEITGHHLRKLAALVIQRRTQLTLTKEDAAKACGIAYQTYWNVEDGQSVRASTYHKIEAGFGIRHGSCTAVAAGDADFITLDDGTQLIENGQIRDSAQVDRLEDEVDRAFDKSAQLTAPHLTLSEAKAMKDQMFKELRDRGVLPGK